VASSNVQLIDVRKQFGTQCIINGVSLEVEPGELVVFVGPSGCGKSTLLRLIAGLEQADAGQILIGGRDVTHTHPSERGIAMVFQSYALYPHMNVADNMAFGLRIRGMGRAEIDRRVADAAAILQLDTLLKRKPRELSGGQRQRVAIGRAIVREPQVFLFDEPLSNLDAALRGQMRVELARLHAKLQATMIYVTHDQVEAMTLASKIVVLNGGCVEQIGAPLDLYARPVNRFVAGFIGSPSMNFIDVPKEQVSSSGGGFELTLQQGRALKLRRSGPASVAGPVCVGIRPEDLIVTADDAPDALLSGEVTLAERLGGETLVHLRCGAGDQLIAKLSGDTPLRMGDRVSLSARADRCHLFDASGMALGVPQ
jgi:multiple sugar transport system ATP-binding protein